MSEHAHELPHGATPDYLTELHGVIASLQHSVDELARAIGDSAYSWPWRDGAVSVDPRLVAAGAVKITYLHATNELGLADAYLNLYDEYRQDAVIVGQTKPKLTLWLPAGGGLADPWVPPAAFFSGLIIAATTSRDGAGAPASSILVDVQTQKLHEHA